MYESGQGVYPTTAQSFYNVNSVYSPMDNGRAAPQISAPAAHVPIYNPALGTDYLSAQAQQAAVRFMTNPQTNQPGYYDSRTMDASIYSAYKSELDARQTAKLLNYGSLAASLSTAAASMMIPGVGMLNPVTLGVTLGAKALDAGAEYYRGFENRIGDIRGIRQMYSGITSGAMIDPTTGRMTNASAMNIVNALDSTAEGSGFTKQDVYQIHSMAGEMGLMQGHTGSASSIASRVKQLATLTKSIMDLGEGISPADALQMQQLTENMGVKLDKFKSLNISRQVVTAARLAGKTLEATNQTLSAAASATAGAGLGGQIGVESALFSTVTANSQFGFLSAEQQAAVGGSAEAFSNNLTQAHATFAARNAQSLAMGSYYLDPATGQLKIDHGALQRMVELGLNPTEANRRGMSLIRGPEANRLLRDRSTRNLVQSVLSRDMGRLSREAASAIDPSTRLGMMGEEIVQRALSTNNLDLRAVATELYGESGAAVLTQIQNYSQGRSRRREAFRNQQLQELDQVVLSGFTSADQIEATARAGYFESLGRAAADRAAGREDMLRREARDRFGATPGQYSTADYLGLIGGEDYSGRASLAGRRGSGFYDRNTSERGFFANLSYNAFTTEAHRNRQVNQTLVSQKMRRLFSNNFFGEGTGHVFENEGRGAIGEFLYNEGFSRRMSGYLGDLSTEMYGEGPSAGASSLGARRLFAIRRALTYAESGFTEQSLRSVREELSQFAPGSRTIRSVLRNLNRDTTLDELDVSLGQGQVKEDILGRVASFAPASRVRLSNLELTGSQRAIVNRAERIGSRFIAEEAGSTGLIAGTRKIDGQDIVGMGAENLARKLIVRAIAREERVTREEAERRFQDMGEEERETLVKGVFAVANENREDNLGRFLGNVGRSGLVAQGLFDAGEEGAMDYAGLQAQGLREGYVYRHSHIPIYGEEVPHEVPIMRMFGATQRRKTGRTRRVDHYAEANISMAELLTGRDQTLTDTDFRAKLEEFGDLYSKLGDGLGRISAMMRTWITSRGRGREYVGKEDRAVVDFLTGGGLSDEIRRKIRALSPAMKERLNAHLKNIITATGATSTEPLTRDQREYRGVSGDSFMNTMNALGVTGIQSKREGMAEEMLQDNPLAQLFGDESDSPARTRNFLRFMRRGDITLIRSGDNNLLDVDASIQRTLGGSMQGLSGDVQERIREVFTNIFAGADPTNQDDMKRRSKRFREAILNQMGSAPVPGQDSSGDTSVAAAATKINMLIQAAAGIIKALAIDDTERARANLEEIKNRLATLAAPSNAPAVSRSGG